MPSLEVSSLKQKAVLWSYAGTDRNGEPKVNVPIELSVRWEKGLSREITPNINPVAVVATVWVDRVVELGSMMRKGPMSDITGTGDDVVNPPDAICEVVDYMETPDIKGRKYERVILLRSYADHLPAVV